MNAPSPPPGVADVKRLREGARWLIRLSGSAVEGESLGDEELAAWIRWYETDCANARAFEQMQDLWDTLGQLERTRLTARLARGRRQESRQSGAAGHAGASGAVGKFLASLAVPGLSGRNRFAWGGLLAAGALSAWVWLAPSLAPHRLELPADGALGTKLAENQEAVLPDGSTVALGAQSSLVLEYAPAARQLKLTHGQAYFNVAKDKTRPFAVDTGDIKIQAVGTAFDVRKNDGRVAVTVTEGIVDIFTDAAATAAASATGAEQATNHGTPIRVAAGYQLIWDKGSADREHGSGRKKTLQLSQVDTAGMTAWRKGRLEYVNEPLSVVIANVNRYSARRLIVEGSDLGSLNFTGTILVDSIDDWLAALQLSFPVSVHHVGNGSLIIRRRASDAPAMPSLQDLSTLRTTPIRHLESG